MNTQKFRELCQQVLIPLLTEVFEHHLIDIHDVINISANELIRIGERLDDIDTRLPLSDDGDE
ncbi:MAG TPA: hypothetical protein VII56_10720 [Rhizomicrobium sp.]